MKVGAVVPAVSVRLSGWNPMCDPPGTPTREMAVTYADVTVTCLYLGYSVGDRAKAGPVDPDDPCRPAP